LLGRAACARDDTPARGYDVIYYITLYYVILHYIIFMPVFFVCSAKITAESRLHGYAGSSCDIVCFILFVISYIYIYILCGCIECTLRVLRVLDVLALREVLSRLEVTIFHYISYMICYVSFIFFIFTGVLYVCVTLQVLYVCIFVLYTYI
jgi:hypothetical protein